ncbi:hypothetical protein MOQ_003530 [Trypanosoma cruzi marinkellei]|uniref:Uncharacterized protein n=1 Tax=Trypanosoma cruzi marinkellei TaxID=85056 RepID=K2NCQ4_TRYCR|nr:hypothetical protein MOQ_003530 [Trypanosoma cruzi marinkellei]
MECSSHRKLMAKQRRPAAVARFLNMFSLEDRHAATNALLLLGLRAYKQAVANAPADIHILRSVVEKSFLDEDGVAAGCEPEKLKVDNSRDKVNDANTMCNPHSFDGVKKANSVLPHSGLTPSIASSLAEERAAKGTGEVKIFGLNNSGVSCARLVPRAETPLPKLETGSTDIQASFNTGYPCPTSCNDCGFSCSCSSSSCGCVSNAHKRISSQSPALSFILNEALGNAVKKRMRSNHTGELMDSFAVGVTTVCPEDDKLTNHDSIFCNVSEGASEEQSHAVDPTVYVSLNSTVVPSSCCDYHYYPLRFLQHVMKRIEDTRGVRENPVLVASSIPQSVAFYTLHASFENLYKSLLVSYHLSFKKGKSSFQQQEKLNLAFT